MPKPEHTSQSKPLRNIAVIAIIAVIVGVSGYYYNSYQTRYVIEEARLDLATIADLKASQIVNWRKERHLEAISIHSNPTIAHRIKHYLVGTEKKQALNEIRTWMESLFNRTGYHKVILFKPNGDVITAFSDNQGPLSHHYHNMVLQASTSGEVMNFDLHLDNATGTVDIDTFIPIMYSEGGNQPECLAVLGIDINPRMQLFPLIRSWPAPSRSGETVLVRRDGDDVLYLNELRFKNGSALQFRLPLTRKDMPAVKAVEGKEEISEGTDYRGVRVLAATRTIHDSPWSIVCKVDLEEVLEPVVERLWYVVGTCLTIIIALSLAISLWWKKQQESFLIKQYDAEIAFNSELMAAEQALLEANTLLEIRVDERTCELIDINTKLRNEIEERGLLEQKLIEAKRLESIGQLAGGVAHEVRNPLNAILSITEALFREPSVENNKDFEPYIHHIRTQVNRLARLMNDLLELGKPLSAACLSPVPLHKFCRDTIKLWHSSGSDKKIPVQLIPDIDTPKLLVLADSMRLQQVLFNLLDNSAQHSPDNNTISLQLEASDSADFINIRVIDYGRGIPEGSLSKIFDPFYTDRKEGTGLGLALVRHFMTNMGGSVVIFNNDPPPGCTAEVRIPRIK